MKLLEEQEIRDRLERIERSVEKVGDLRSQFLPEVHWLRQEVKRLEGMVGEYQRYENMIREEYMTRCNEPGAGKYILLRALLNDVIATRDILGIPPDQDTHAGLMSIAHYSGLNRLEGESIADAIKRLTGKSTPKEPTK